jgi:acyl-CoA thioesterase-1
MLLYCTILERRAKLIRAALALTVVFSLSLTMVAVDVHLHVARADSSSSAPEALPHIVAFGDSLTAGLGVSANDAYPAQLQRRLDAQGFRYRVINAGVSGETTAGGLRRVPWVLKNKPEIVILELGANDGLRGLRLEETKANLEQIIQQVQRSGARIILAGMRLPPNYGKDYIAGFERMFPELADRYHLPLIPFFLEGVAASDTLNQADGIHPTAEGYERVVEGVFQKLRPLLKKDSPTPQGDKQGLLPR